MIGSGQSGLLQDRQLDVDAAALGLLLALALFPLRFLAADVYVETIPVVLGVACGCYLLAVRVGPTRHAGTPTAGFRRPTLSPGLAAALPPLAFTGIAAMIAVAAYTGRRSLGFYAVAGAVGTLVLLQVLFVHDDEHRPGVSLAQVVALAATVRLAGLYTTRGLVGIDVWTHHRLAESVLQAGSLSAIAGDKHVAAPLYHLLVVATSLLADVPLETALELSVGLAVPVSVLLVYGTARLLVPARWAVFAGALYAVADYAVEWGIHLIPTSMGLVLYLAVLYAMVRVMQSRYRARDFILLALLSMAVVLTHQVSSFIMLVTVAAGVLAQLILRLDVFRPSPLELGVFSRMGPANLLGLGVFDFGLTIFAWSFTPYRGETFLGTVASYLVQTLASSAGFLNLADPSGGGAGGAGGQRVPAWLADLALYVDTVGFLLLLGATFVGCLYVIRRDRLRHAGLTLLLAAAVMLVFVLGLPLFGVRNFIPQRWFAFLYGPMAVLAAVGVRFLAGRFHRRTFVVVAVVFALLFPAVMVASSNGTVDSPVFADQRARLSYTGTELAAVHTIGAMTGSPDSANLRPDQVLYTDHPYQTVFTRTRAYPADTAVVVDGQPVTHRLTVYRDHAATGATFFVDANGNGRIRDVPPSRICRPSQSQLYDNGDVRMCAR